MANGGMERVLANKANHLVNHGHEVHVISIQSTTGRQPFFAIDPRVRMWSLDCDGLYRKGLVRKLMPWRGRRAFLARLSAVLAQIRPEVAIALHDAHARYLYAADGDSPKVLELHFAKHKRAQYLYALEESRWLRPLVDLYKAPFYRLIRHYDRFVVLTEEDRTAWQRPGVDNIVVIPNAQTFPCTVQATLDHRRVIALGRNTPQKQFDALLRAWSLVAGRNPGWRLAIIGSGDKQDLARLADRLGISASVDLGEATRDVQGELLRSSAFALTSRYEGLPMILIEAMSCGVPVVSFACRSGPTDIIRDGQDGFLVPAGDVAGFARRLQALMSDPALRQAMGDAAFHNVRRFDEATVMHQWLDLFERLVRTRT